MRSYFLLSYYKINAYSISRAKVCISGVEVSLLGLFGFP